MAGEEPDLPFWLFDALFISFYGSVCVFIHALPFSTIIMYNKRCILIKKGAIDTMKMKCSKDKVISLVINISRTGLYVLAGCMLLWLNISSRSIQGGVAVFIVLLLSVGLGGLLERIVLHRTYLEWLVLGVCCALFWLACMRWVAIVPYHMEGDQAIVWQSAVFALQGNFSMYSHGGQMFIYPQQQGLAFLYEILFRLTGSDSHQMIGYINATLAPLTLSFGYLCVKEISGTKAAVRFLPFMMMCLPYIIYSPYVYGDIPSISLSFVLLWSILKFTTTMRYRYAVLACGVAAVALICRKNIWIFLIGVLIGLGYQAWQKWNLKPVLFAVCIVLCASLSMTAIKQFNSIRSGYPVSEGMPTVLWIAMGLQYSEYGAGYYNNYSKEVYQKVGCDGEQAAAIGWQEVKDRVKIFMEYPDQCWMFFREKMKSQWVDPLFESVKFTGTFDEDNMDGVPSMILEIYQGEAKDTLRKICSIMMSVVYFFSLIGVGFRYFKKKPIVEDIPLIVFVGGFLFSIFWEAKARYMFPYFVLLQLYAAYGLTDMTEVIKVRVLKLASKRGK